MNRTRRTKTPTPVGSDRLIVVGSSAGGIEALSALVASLVPPFPAPIVVAQHLDPSHRSHLEEILSRRSTLPIRTVVQPTALESGVVYVVPPDRHVTITGQEVTVRVADGRGPKPSVDLLLKSAAKVFGERSVAVILTGSGSDGTAGAAAVKAAGGVVVIQNPTTASFPSMPRSLPPSSVDVVCELSEMGEILRRIVSGEVPPDGEDDHEVSLLLDRLRSSHGIDFGAYKRPTILRRLQSRLAATGNRTVGDYARYIQEDPVEHQRLVSSFLIKVTSFFRDPNVLTYIRDTVLPDLIKAARGSGELRLWSAGCATGEEAYSLAILVAELLRNEPGRIDVRIFATDVDEEALAFGRRGVYSRAELRGVSAARRKAYFTEVEGECEVSKQIRNMVVFGQHDLGVRAPFPRIDLILCRNVLIYFTPELQQRALSVFAYSLRGGGRLVLGSSESVAPLANEFLVEEARLKVFRARTDGPAPVAAQPRPRRPTAGLRPTGLERSIATTRLERDRRRLSVEHAEWVINELPIGIVVVDGTYKTLRINVEARELLGIHGPALGDDFIHLAEALPATELRAAIRGAVDGRTTVAVYGLPGPDLPTSHVRHIQLTASPHRASQEGPIEGALLVFADVLRAEVDRQAVGALTTKLEEAAERHRRLIEANRGLATANDQLRLANEDFLFTAEEAQSAREEMETLAEELQATNEELETLNEELQATNEELTTANEDLASTLKELAAERADLATARDRLASVLDGMSDALLVVDRDGQTAITNKAYDAMFGRPGTKFIPQDETGTDLPKKAWPRERARQGKAFRMEFTFGGNAVGRDDEGRRWFEATGEGLRLADRQWAGVVVIRDITDRSVRQLEEQFLARASHELRTPLAALHGNIQLLVRRLDAAGDGNDKIGRYATSALAQTRALSALVDRLFDLSGVMTDRFDVERQPTELVALARRVVEVAGGLDTDARLAVIAGRPPVRVQADALRIEQALLGLLTNSIVHGAASRIDVHVRSDGDDAVLSVTDDGRGIPEADQPMLFDRLARVASDHRTSKPGLGLGLYLAREIVSAHGGTIALASEEGRGTAVTIRLPRVVTRRRR